MTRRSKAATEVPGALVAAVPSVGVVLFTGADSTTRMAAVRASVERVRATGERLLSRQLYVWAQAHWEEWLPVVG
jgi:hypothetical protein